MKRYYTVEIAVLQSVTVCDVEAFSPADALAKAGDTFDGGSFVTVYADVQGSDILAQRWFGQPGAGDELDPYDMSHGRDLVEGLRERIRETYSRVGFTPMAQAHFDAALAALSNAEASLKLASLYQVEAHSRRTLIPAE